MDTFVANLNFTEKAGNNVTKKQWQCKNVYTRRFPIKRPRNGARSKSCISTGQEKDDFYLALQLQQQEIEIDSDHAESVTCSEDEDQIQYCK